MKQASRSLLNPMLAQIFVEILKKMVTERSFYTKVDALHKLSKQKFFSYVL